MKTVAHQGTVIDAVTLKFDNGYSVTFDAGYHIAIHVVADDPKHPTRLTYDKNIKRHRRIKK